MRSRTGKFQARLSTTQYRDSLPGLLAGFGQVLQQRAPILPLGQPFEVEAGEAKRPLPLEKQIDIPAFVHSLGRVDEAVRLSVNDEVLRRPPVQGLPPPAPWTEKSGVAATLCHRTPNLRAHQEESPNCE
jgi:hypothetical protein